MAGTTNHHHETRVRLIRAAEEMFAERGFEATSVRDLTARAGCNVAAVNYHFGDKETLYVETVRQLLRELRERRIDLIGRALEDAGEDATLELFLEAFATAFLDPLLEEARGRLLMVYMDREMHHGRLPPEVLFGELIRPLAEYTTGALRRVVGPIDDETARMCLMSMVGQLIHSLKLQRMVRSGGAPEPSIPTDLGEHVRHFVRFSAAGVRACLDGRREPAGEDPR